MYRFTSVKGLIAKSSEMRVWRSCSDAVEGGPERDWSCLSQSSPKSTEEDAGRGIQSSRVAHTIATIARTKGPNCSSTLGLSTALSTTFRPKMDTVASKRKDAQH